MLQQQQHYVHSLFEATAVHGWNPLHQLCIAELTLVTAHAHEHSSQTSNEGPVMLCLLMNVALTPPQLPCCFVAASINVTATYPDAKVVFALDILFARVEFGSLVHEGAACLTAYGHWQHHAHFHLIVLLSLSSGQLGRIKVRRVILIEDLSFTHCDRLENYCSRLGEDT